MGPIMSPKRREKAIAFGKAFAAVQIEELPPKIAELEAEVGSRSP
jgi:hypothetical protein